MTALLHISASPRGTTSESLGIADAFLEAFRGSRPEVEIETWDLWDGALPSFGPEGAGAKMRVFAGERPIGAQEEAWHRAQLAFERLQEADLYLFSVPMWNHGVPYILKQLIDVVSQPGMVFDFDPESGYTGLLEGKRAAVIYTSAVYGVGRGAGFGTDFQQPYFDDWMRWAGIEQVSTVTFRPNLATANASGDRIRAVEEARRAGAEFATEATASIAELT